MLRTAFVEQWLGQEARGSEQREDEPVIGETAIALPCNVIEGKGPNVAIVDYIVVGNDDKDQIDELLKAYGD